MDCLAWLKGIHYRCVANMKASIIIMIVTQNPVNNSILGLHLGREMVSSSKFVHNGKFG